MAWARKRPRNKNVKSTCNTYSVWLQLWTTISTSDVNTYNVGIWYQVLIVTCARRALAVL